MLFRDISCKIPIFQTLGGWGGGTQVCKWPKYTMGVHGTGVPLASLFKPPVLGPHRPCFVTLSSSCAVWENWHGSCPDGMASAASTAHSSSQKTQFDYIYSHVLCRRWYGKGCCGRCCCSPCARDGWPYSCFESWKAGLETPAAANQSRSQGPGWFNFILVCHVCVGEAVLTFHRATCTFIFPISGFFWWSCIAPASHHLYFQSFCFSSAPGEKTTQSPEIGGQTEHPRPLAAPGLQNDPSAVAASSKLYVSLKHLWLLSPEESAAASSKLYVSLKHLWLLSPEESAAASSKLYVSLKHLRLLSLKESDRNVVKSHAAGYLTTAVSQGIKNTFLRALAPVFAVAPKNY